MNFLSKRQTGSDSKLFLRLAALLWFSFGFSSALNAQEQTGDLLSDGPKQSIVLENGTPAMKFVSKDGSVAFVYFRKHGGEDSFAINVREFKFGGEKTGWIYFTPTRIVFDSDDNGNRSFDIPKGEAKLKTETGHGGRWFIINVSGKEKRFMVSFTPPRPLGKQQDPVFELIRRLMNDYDAAVSELQKGAAKLAQPGAQRGADSNPLGTPQAKSEETNILMEVTSEPSGAEIYLDGSFTGSTPSKLSVKVGEHSIKVMRPGFKDWERRIVLDPVSSRSLNAILEKKEP